MLHQYLQMLLRCHMQAFEALNRVPIEILYDRMSHATQAPFGLAPRVIKRMISCLSAENGSG